MTNQDSPWVSMRVENNVLIATLLTTHLRDGETAHGVADQVIARARSLGTNHVVFDAAQVEYIGSIGLLAFLRVRRELASSRIVLCHLNPTMRQYLEVCRLIPSKLAPVAPFEAGESVAEAVTVLGQAEA